MVIHGPEMRPIDRARKDTSAVNESLSRSSLSSVISLHAKFQPRELLKVPILSKLLKSNSDAAQSSVCSMIFSVVGSSFRS
jgi:hypothetical protein